jgi:CheY-like chemotaxis protein
VVDGDEARLAQVVSNLLTNAAKYTEAGGRIAITARAEDGEVVVRVRDSGTGIDPKLLPSVFDLFVQDRQAIDRSRGGLGLGLAIVRNLVALHGGSVRASSAGKGQGSEFEVRLPRVAAVSESPSRVDIAPGRTARPHAARVLVVDDNVEYATLLAETLTELGYAARHVHDGLTALSVADAFVPDVALVDIGLPVMDGYEVAMRLAAHPQLSATRLIAITGYGQREDRARSRDAGFVAHLVKPIDLDTLQATIESRITAKPDDSAKR